MIGSRIRVLAVASLAIVAGQACAQGTLYGLQFNGTLSTIDLTNGAVSIVGSSGGVQWNAAAADPNGQIWAFSFLFQSPNSFSDLYTVDSATGAATRVAPLGGVPANATVRGMAFDSDGRLFVIVDQGGPDFLGQVDVTNGLFLPIGSTGRTDIQGLACDSNGQLWGVSVLSNVISRIDRNTGQALVVGGVGIPDDNQTVEFDDAGNMYVLRTNLKRVDPATGNATLIGAVGGDYRGMAFVGSGPPPCYADCDTSTGVGVLDIFDFLCFGNRFAAGDPYACDCDTTTGLGVCDIFDFLCFGNAFNAGCP